MFFLLAIYFKNLLSFLASDSLSDGYRASECYSLPLCSSVWCNPICLLLFLFTVFLVILSENPHPFHHACFLFAACTTVLTKQNVIIQVSSRIQVLHCRIDYSIQNCISIVLNFILTRITGNPCACVCVHTHAHMCVLFI